MSRRSKEDVLAQLLWENHELAERVYVVSRLEEGES